LESQDRFSPVTADRADKTPGVSLETLAGQGGTHGYHAGVTNFASTSPHRHHATAGRCTNRLTTAASTASGTTSTAFDSTAAPISFKAMFISRSPGNMVQDTRCLECLDRSMETER
jgi:hypothetical protein